MIEGAYYEFVAFPCGGDRYSMPLGLVWGPNEFYVYRTAGLFRRLGRSGTLILLSPNDPLAFARSVDHTLELEASWDGGCPRPEPAWGAWYRCEYELRSADGEGASYVCRTLERVAGEPPPYSRVYGCLVELLVLLTKARAGVAEPWYLGYARGLKWCVERASRGNGRYVLEAERVLRELEGALGEAERQPRGLQRDRGAPDGV